MTPGEGPPRPRGIDSWLRTALVALTIVYGIHLRTRGIADVSLYGDEYHTADAADQGYRTILTHFDTLGSHVPLPLLQRVSLDLFGAGVVPFRLVALVPGILTLLLVYPFARRLVGPTSAALATLLLALSPIHVYYSRFARSYALVVLLALAAIWALVRVLESEGRRWPSRSCLVTSAALLPYVHLSSAGFALAIGVVAVFLAWRRSPRLGREVFGLFALAAVICGLLYLPILDQVRAYFGWVERDEYEPSSWFGVPTLLAGGRTEALAWCLAVPVALAGLWRERRDGALLCAAAILGPLVTVLATLPRGMDYAYARYLLSTLPCCVALVGWAFVALWRRLLRGEALAERAALGAALLLLAASHLAGPIGPFRVRDGGFSNTELALHSLPAFDVPFSATPAFYRQLANDSSARKIVEAPPICTRSVLLYRNYAIQHGKEVVMGWHVDVPRGIQGDLSPSLFGLEPGDADYVILHRDPLPELRAYYRFVYRETWPRMKSPGDESFMARLEQIRGQTLKGREVTDIIAAQLRARYGPPQVEDERISVWKLDRP